MAPFFIVALTFATLWALQTLLAARPAAPIHPAQVTAALLLPLLGSYAGVYALFAAGVILLMAVAPAATREGILLPHPEEMELRAALYLFILPLMPILSLTIAVSGLTIAQITYVHLATFGFALALLRSGLPAAMPPFAFCAALLLLVQFAIDARGGSLTYAGRAAVQVLLGIGLPYWAVSRAFAEVRAPSRILFSLIAAGCLLSVFALFETLRHWLLFETMPYQIGADPEIGSGYAKLRGGMLRARATYNESTGLSLFLGLMIVMLMTLRHRLGLGGLRTALLCLILAAGVFATFARVGYIVVAVGLVAAMLYDRNWPGLIRLGILLPLAAAALVILSAVIPAVAASTGLSGEAEGSVDYRSMMFDAGVAIVRSNWLTGLSLADIYSRLDFLKQGEGIVDLINQPLTLFMRAGVIGGCLYFLILGVVLTGLFRHRIALEPDARAAAGACFATLVAMIAGLTTTSFGRNESLYICLLAAGAGLLSRVPRARAAAPLIGYREKQPLGDPA